MFETLSSLLSTLWHAVGTAVLVVALPIASFFGYAHPSGAETPPLGPSITIATSSLRVASTTLRVPARTPSAPANAPSKPRKNIPIAPLPIQLPIEPAPPVGTTTEVTTVGTTTLAIQSIPLLEGGVVHAGESVPISYLQITNIGNEGALLKGFWVKQNGSAAGEAVIALSTVDDKGGSRGFTGGNEGATPFQNNLALAPTDAYFAPGQMRLFTIKATLTRNISPYIGTQLVIDLAALETTAMVRGSFPIRGTTWIIAQ